MVKDLLLIVENSAHANPIIHASVIMAERMAADLTIEILSCSPVLIPALAPMTTMYVPDWATEEDQAKRVNEVTHMVAGSTAAIRVVGLENGLFAVTRRAGRIGPVADLVLIGGEDLWDTQWLRHHASETIVMEAGAPLLILGRGNALPPVCNAVIGLKDSPEGRRAVRDLAIIAEPEAKITVVSVGGFADEEPLTTAIATEVVRYLGRHGLRAEWKQLDNDELSDAENLEAFALDVGADLLAIGAYGHSRLRETVFGGVTRTFLNHARLPVLFSR